MTPLKSSQSLAQPLTQGYYADPYSPIASTPKPGPATVKMPFKRPLEERDQYLEQEEKSETWTSTLFSPMLKQFFGDEEDKEELGADVHVPHEVPELSIEQDEEEQADNGHAQVFPTTDFDPFLFIAQLPPYDQVKGVFQSPAPARTDLHPRARTCTRAH
jgi:hypothetical protein